LQTLQSIQFSAVFRGVLLRSVLTLFRCSYLPCWHCAEILAEWTIVSEDGGFLIETYHIVWSWGERWIQNPLFSYVSAVGTHSCTHTPALLSASVLYHSA